jgi:hypothetical protein
LDRAEDSAASYEDLGGLYQEKNSTGWPTEVSDTSGPGGISNSPEDPIIREPTLAEASSQPQRQVINAKDSPPLQLTGAVPFLKRAVDESDDYDKYAEADIAELQARILTAEADATEAEAVAEEAVAMLESERAERRASAALAAQLQRDIDWAHKKAVKERAEWETRMKDAFRKMESTVLLVERVQKEKAELSERLAVVVGERQKLHGLVDEKSIQEAVSVLGNISKDLNTTSRALTPFIQYLNVPYAFVLRASKCRFKQKWWEHWSRPERSSNWKWSPSAPG